MDGPDTRKAKYLTAVASAADESARQEVQVAAIGKKDCNPHSWQAWARSSLTRAKLPVPCSTS